VRYTVIGTRYEQVITPYQSQFLSGRDVSGPGYVLDELIFTMPANVGGGGVENVPGIMVKDSENARGVAIAGMSVRLTAGYFLIGLSPADVQANQSLLKEGRWFDIPIVYKDGTRAILAIEKGSPGERAFEEVFASWPTNP